MAGCPDPEQLAAFAENACSDQEARRIAAHLAQCSTCAQWVEDAKVAGALLPDIRAGLGSELADQDNPAAEETQDAPEGGGPVHANAVDALLGYEIIRELGRGGMGVVYEAKQEKPRRTVALKVIRPGVVTPELLRRFEHEAQVLGRLQHPGIAQIYEAGTHETTSNHGREGADLGLAGRVPYFAMEYIPDAKPITDYTRDRNLDLRARLQLLAEICDAVQHAHQKGVIHRDLKPGNILVSEAGRPKILDFGVARVTDCDIQATTMQTDIGQLIGTIQYMSPEQAAGDPHELDTRSDVYALGVIAYELLTNRLPYDIRQQMIHEAVRVIREDDPTPLSSVNRVFRGDLETIVAKALEKEKDRRYQSASDLASDIQHYLSDEPIAARPASSMYQFRKFARRNKALVGGVVAVFVVLVAGIIATSIALSREAEQRQIAEAAVREQDRAREEAAEAWEQEQQRADELKTVTKFQASMLSGIDVEEMGRTLFADLRQRLRDSLESSNTAPKEISTALESLDSVLKKVNATDLVRTVIDACVLAPAARTIEPEFAEQRWVASTLRQSIGDTYNIHGMYEQALPQMERALAIRRQALGLEHEDTLASMASLASLNENLGRYDEAEALYNQTLELRRQLLGEEHRHTLASMASLAGIYMLLGRYAEAEPLYQMTLDLHRRVLGAEHQQTLVVMNDLAVLYSQLSRYADAARLCEQTLEIQRRVRGEEHPETLASMSNLAELYNSQGRYDQAEPLYSQTVDLHRRVWGAEHPHTLTTINNLAGFYMSHARYADAESLYQQTLEVSRRVLGEEHPDTLLNLRNLAVSYHKQSRHDEAEPLIARAVSGARRALPQGHSLTGVFLGDQGMMLIKLARYEEAETALLESLETLVATLGAQHGLTVGVNRAIIDLYDAMHDAEPGRSYNAKAAEWRAKLPVEE